MADVRQAEDQSPRARTVHKPPAIMNRLIGLVLRSPLHGVLSNNLMLLTFTGRTSGQQFTTPVTYTRDGNQLTVFSSNPWWKNLRGGALVTLRIKGRRLQGVAEPSTLR